MIFAILIYKSSSGVTAWKKTFGEFLSREKLEMVSAFFSAIQGYANKLSDDILDTIDMGIMKITFNRLADVGADVVIVHGDIKDRKVHKIHKRIKRVLNKHKEFLQQDWSDTKKFKALLEADLLEVLSKYKKYLGTKRQEIQDSIENIEEREEEQLEVYKKELNRCYNVIKDTKQSLSNRIQALKRYEKIRSQSPSLSKQQNSDVQQYKKQLKKEKTEEVKRLQYYLDNLKSSVNKFSNSRGTKNDVYLSLYSLATKLEKIGNPMKSKELKYLSKKIKKEDSNVNELMLKILQLPDDPSLLIDF